MTNEQQLNLALKLYGLDCSEAELIRHNENMTYKVNAAGGRYVLRIHKPVEGFSLGILDSEGGRASLIQNELELIYALGKETALTVQTPVRGINGNLTQELPDGTNVSMLKWLDGQTLENAESPPEILRGTGRLVAVMHKYFIKNTERYKAYHRYSYDQSLLPLLAARLNAASDFGAVTKEQALTLLGALDEIRVRFDELDSLQDKCIVHADLSKSNMILTVDGKVAPIDFSLCGFSHFYMDIGGLFGHYNDVADRRLILEGYKSARDCELKPRYIEPYFALNVILFVACQYERANQWDWFSGAMERWNRDIFTPLADKTDFLGL